MLKMHVRTSACDCTRFYTKKKNSLKTTRLDILLTVHSAPGFWDFNILASLHFRDSADIIINLDLGGMVILCAYPGPSQEPLQNVCFRGS